MKKLKLLVIGLLLGILFVGVLGLIHAGGGGTYLVEISADGSIAVVIDTRTSTLRIVELDSMKVTKWIRVFDEDERKLKDYH